MKYEVRCCCQPGKLLGWLDGPDDVLGFFDVFERGDLAAPGEPPKKHWVSVCHLDYNEIVEHEDQRDENGDVPVELVPTTICAVYSDDRPIEFWRRIQGFEEARP